MSLDAAIPNMTMPLMAQGDVIAQCTRDLVDYVEYNTANSLFMASYIRETEGLCTAVTYALSTLSRGIEGGVV